LNPVQLQRFEDLGTFPLMDLIASKNISLEDNNLMNPQGGMMLDIQTIDTGDLIIKGVLGISRNIVLGRAYNTDGD
jgi:hypothetical protein